MNKVINGTPIHDDDKLSYTHAKRKQLVEHMLQNGIPGDLDDKKFLSSLLKDVDSQTISLRRIRVDEKSNDNVAKNRDFVANLLGRIKINTGITNIVDGEAAVILELPSSVPPPVLVEGELSTVIESQSYDQFMAQFDNLPLEE